MCARTRACTCTALGTRSHARARTRARTGKTLIARQIGKMLNGKEPKIVNGPEVLNKYVGASEENIRNLFKARGAVGCCSGWHACA